MANDALETFIVMTRADWGPLTSQRIAACRERLMALVAAAPTEAWLGALLEADPGNYELYRDPQHGFVLMAHVEPAGLFRPPHDHGDGWVIYAMQSGEIEMRSYGRIAEPDGQERLVQRDGAVLHHGQVQPYLPGDVHDTRCLQKALQLRFTDRDLKVEDRQGRLSRFVDRDGVWTTARA